jgi:hypothetical protein
MESCPDVVKNVNFFASSKFSPRVFNREKIKVVRRLDETQNRRDPRGRGGA